MHVTSNLSLITNNNMVKVLYLHGLEENQKSPKPAELKAQDDLQVVQPDLHVYFTHKNGAIPLLIKNHRIWKSLIAAVLVSLSVKSLGVGVLSYIALLFVQKDYIRSEVVKESLKRTYRVAKQALESSKPDIVVGFSWGGCLATMLLASGRWNGPTIMLAPAYISIFNLAKISGTEKSVTIDKDTFETESAINLTEEQRGLVKIIIAGDDKIVPQKQLRKFCDLNKFETTVVSGAAHKLWKFKKVLPIVIRSLL